MCLVTDGDMARRTINEYRGIILKLVVPVALPEASLRHGLVNDPVDVEQVRRIGGYSIRSAVECAIRGVVRVQRAVATITCIPVITIVVAVRVRESRICRDISTSSTREAYTLRTIPKRIVWVTFGSPYSHSRLQSHTISVSHDRS